MIQSSVIRLTTEMLNIERNSQLIIPPEEYYCVKISIEKACDVTENISKFLLISEPRPMFVYYNDMYVILFFSCVDVDLGEKHQHDGIHSLIISKYISSIFRENLIPTEPSIFVQIIQFTTQTIIYTYVSWLVFETSRAHMIKLVNSKNDIQFNTYVELKDVLKNKGILWDEQPSGLRFGTLLKYSDKTIRCISEYFDARDSKKHTSFMFGR